MVVSNDSWKLIEHEKETKDQSNVCVKDQFLTGYDIGHRLHDNGDAQ